MRVGYVPYSKDLSHPADRRRLAFWAQQVGIELNVSSPLESDILILSNAANFGYWIRRAKQPVIIDLVDGYLAEKSNFLQDILRNFSRSLAGQSGFHWVSYKFHIRVACQRSAAVIVASPEQRDLVLPFNSQTYVILDSHAEVSNFAQHNSGENTNNSQQLFWEGFGYTLKHFEVIAEELDQFLFDSGWGMYMVTQSEFPRWGGYIGKVHTQKEVRKLFPKSWHAIRIIPWSIENLRTYSELATIGLIPLNQSDLFANMKSENKLLSMWQLNLPVLFSPTPAYLRVASMANVEIGVVQLREWYKKLIYLSENPEVVDNLKLKGHHYVDKYHTTEVLIRSWTEALSQTINTSNL